MGSEAEAVLAGFICRLCSHPKKSVTHIFSAKGKKMNLLKKLAVIPICLKETDRLPKTICASCIESLDKQYVLVKQIRKSIMVQQTHRRYHTNGQCPMDCPLNNTRRFSNANPELLEQRQLEESDRSQN